MVENKSTESLRTCQRSVSKAHQVFVLLLSWSFQLIWVLEITDVFYFFLFKGSYLLSRQVLIFCNLVLFVGITKTMPNRQLKHV